MYTFFESQPVCQQTFADERFRVFGGSYSEGCGFDPKVAAITSERFAFASDTVKLVNAFNVDSGCLGTDLSFKLCDSGAAAEWTFVFNGGQLFFADASNNMQCLTHDGSSGGLTVSVSRCDNTEPRQRWSFDGDKDTISPMAVSPASCLVSNNVGNTQVALGSCTDPSARWVQFSECKLNSRLETSPMKVESIGRAGQCIASNGTTVTSCEGADAGTWKYIYDANNPRLVLTGVPNQCLGRFLAGGDYVGYGDGAITDLPTGMTFCNDSTSSPSYAFSLLQLTGEEGNVFKYDNPITKPRVAYCIEVPADKMTECDADLTKEQTWRAYGSERDATEISVSPKAVLSEITDPEALFQLYLFSAEGKASRKLRALTAALVRDVERVIPKVFAALGVTETATTVLGYVQQPADSIKSRLSNGADSFKLFSNIIRPFEFVPYINTPIKATKLRSLTNFIGKRMQSGENAVGSVSSKLNLLQSPIGAFGGSLARVLVGLNLVSTIDSFVDYLTRSAFCAYQKEMTEYYDMVQGWITTMSGKVTQAMSFLSGLPSPLSALDTLKSLTNKFVLKPFNVFGGIMKVFDVFINLLSFLKVIADFSFTLPFYPEATLYISFKIPFIGRIRIPIWFKFVPKEIDLELVGDLLGKIEAVRCSDVCK